MIKTELAERSYISDIRKSENGIEMEIAKEVIYYLENPDYPEGSKFCKTMAYPMRRIDKEWVPVREQQLKAAPIIK